MTLIPNVECKIKLNAGGYETRHCLVSKFCGTFFFKEGQAWLIFDIKFGKVFPFAFCKKHQAEAYISLVEKLQDLDWNDEKSFNSRSMELQILAFMVVAEISPNKTTKH